MKTYKSHLKRFSIKKEQTDFKKVQITSSRDAAEYARNFYHDDMEIYESMFMILLNNSNNTIGYCKISQGGIVGTLCDIRILAFYCIESLATGCILVHNHPSGKLKPSVQDISLTKKTQAALDTLDIKLLDHIIVTSESYYSMADEMDY